MKNIDVQKALNAAGFGPLITDGDIGPMSKAAIKRFQRSKGLMADGIVGRNTTAALLPFLPVAKLRKENFPWIELGLTKLGLNEDRDNAKLREFLKSDGKTLGDPAKLPWCGDFVETCIRLALPQEKLPANSYLARNWGTEFGKEVEPQYGAILVFWRGTKSGTSGHVGFYLGEGATTFKVLGGNQSDGVTIATLKKDRLLHARFPLTGIKPSGLQNIVGDSGKISVNEE